MPVIQFRSPQCVMVRIPKTGSTSIVKGLLGGMENASEIRYGEFPDEWQDLYSFAVVRNPFDRLVSAFVMFQTYPTKTEEEREFQANLTLDQMMDVVESPEYSPALTDYFSRLKLHAIPMSHPFFCMEKVRDVFRFEEFDAAFRKLAETLATLAKLNQSNPKGAALSEIAA